MFDFLLGVVANLAMLRGEDLTAPQAPSTRGLPPHNPEPGISSIYFVFSLNFSFVSFFNFFEVFSLFLDMRLQTFGFKI